MIRTARIFAVKEITEHGGFVGGCDQNILAVKIIAAQFGKLFLCKYGGIDGFFCCGAFGFGDNGFCHSLCFCHDGVKGERGGFFGCDSVGQRCIVDDDRRGAGVQLGKQKTTAQNTEYLVSVHFHIGKQFLCRIYRLISVDGNFINSVIPIIIPYLTEKINGGRCYFFMISKNFDGTYSIFSKNMV